MHTRNAERRGKKGGGGGLCRERAALMRAERVGGRRREVYLCVHLISVRRRAVYDRRRCVLPQSVTLVLSHISVWFIIVIEAGPCSPDITSLTGAHMQMKPVFILIDDYILKQPAVK